MSEYDENCDIFKKNITESGFKANIDQNNLEANDATDITRNIHNSKSKLDELRENRIDEVIKKSENAVKQVSDNIIKEAEQRIEKKRKSRKKKIDGDNANLPNTNNIAINNSNTEILENMSKDQLISLIKNKNNDNNLNEKKDKLKEKKIPKKDVSAKDEPKKGFKSTNIKGVLGAEFAKEDILTAKFNDIDILLTNEIWDTKNTDWLQQIGRMPERINKQRIVRDKQLIYSKQNQDKSLSDNLQCIELNKLIGNYSKLQEQIKLEDLESEKTGISKQRDQRDDQFDRSEPLHSLTIDSEIKIIETEQNNSNYLMIISMSKLQIVKVSDSGIMNIENEFNQDLSELVDWNPIRERGYISDAIIFQNSGNYIAVVGSFQNKILIQNISNKTKISTISLPQNSTSIQVLKHQRNKTTNKLVIGTYDNSGGRVYVQSLDTYKQLANLNTEHNCAVHAMDVHNSLGICATGSEGDKTMEIWDLEERDMVHKVKKLGDSQARAFKPGVRFNVFKIAFTMDGSVAFMNSNNAWDQELKIVVPNKKYRIDED